jgi:hypothetical protein
MRSSCFFVAAEEVMGAAETVGKQVARARAYGYMRG